MPGIKSLGRLEKMIERLDRDINFTDATLTAPTITDAASISSAGNLTVTGVGTFAGLLSCGGLCALGTDVPMSAGTGITGATGEVYLASVITKGSIIYTDILIDLTGLADGGTAGDIIGKDGGTANCHIGQVTAAINGTILGGTVTCLEVPAGGDPDVDLWYADNATGAQEAAVTTLTNQIQVTNNGDHTIGRVTPFLNTVVVPADKYMYLTCGDTTDGVYNAGRLLIQMWGWAG